MCSVDTAPILYRVKGLVGCCDLVLIYFFNMTE